MNAREIKLNVKPLFFTMYHDYVFEGPCRAGGPEQLTKAYDDMQNAVRIDQFKKDIAAELGNVEYINLLPDYWSERNEEFLVSEKELDRLLEDDAKTDVYLVGASARLTDLLIPFAQKAKKPIVLMPLHDPMQTIAISALRSRGIKEAYAYLTWQETRDNLDVLRTRKVLENLRVLCVSRYGCSRSVSGMDNFVDFETVTQKLGVNFVYSNLHEFLDQMVPLNDEKNHTLPGRRALNPTKEDMAEIDRLADELMNGATECTMRREEVVRSVTAYYVIDKMLKYYECNAFSAVCPDACATRRLNELRLTFCMTHSLFNGCGVASSCEYDVPAAVSMTILSALGHKPSYMGNTTHNIAFGSTKIGVGLFSDTHPVETENTILTWHAVTNLHMHGYDTPTEPYLMHPFTASGFGVTLRYDFARDNGTEITMCRVDPSCSKLFVAKGVITGCAGYKDDSCSIGAFIKVADERDFYEKQLSFGNHVPFIYGDCFDKICAFGRLMGLEVVTA